MAVLADGKQAYLAKPPILLRDIVGPLPDPPSDPLNLLILEYHVVLDELAVEFGLPSTRPNLFSHGEAVPEEDLRGMLHEIGL